MPPAFTRADNFKLAILTCSPFAAIRRWPKLAQWTQAFAIAIVCFNASAASGAQSDSIFPQIPLLSNLYDSEITSPSFGLYEGWSASYELGMNGSEGNAVSFNLSTGLNLERKTESQVSKISLNYANASNDGILVRDFALLRGRNEYLFADSPWSLFTEGLIEYDRFQAFDYRLTLASGLGYRFIENETSLVKGRIGLGTSREFGGPNEEWKPELVLGLDLKHQLSERQKLYCTVDYYPNLTDFSDFRLIADAGWELLLDQATHTSLKIGIIDRYDSTPEGRRANDLNYSVLLLWKTK